MVTAEEINAKVSVNITTIRKAKLWDDLKHILKHGTWTDESTITEVLTQMENIEVSLDLKGQD